MDGRGPRSTAAWSFSNDLLFDAAMSARPYLWVEATPKQKQFVGHLIREARLARDLTPLEAARQAGVSRGTFYRWERGRIGSATVLVLDWLLHDSTESHDAFYWRERALLAEDALSGIARKLEQYRNDREP